MAKKVTKKAVVKKPVKKASRPAAKPAVKPAAKSLEMDLNDIHELIKFVSKTGVAEVDLETSGVKIVIKTTSGTPVVHTSIPVQQAVMPAVQAPASVASTQEAPKPAAATSGNESNFITIKSPMIGTFYRKPSPDKPLFVNVGDTIKPGKVLCIIEAMKLFNEIESEVSGKIVKILVDDSSPVEYDQPLFLVDPS
jgi:acetyl-CoA carboxylase biotin carboxyl carrier protein